MNNKKIKLDEYEQQEKIMYYTDKYCSAGGDLNILTVFLAEG